jgi:hypothetical protein
MEPMADQPPHQLPHEPSHEPQPEPAPAVHTRSRSLWRHRDFLLLRSGQSISEIGSDIPEHAMSAPTASGDEGLARV